MSGAIPLLPLCAFLARTGTALYVDDGAAGFLNRLVIAMVLYGINNLLLLLDSVVLESYFCFWPESSCDPRI